MLLAAGRASPARARQDELCKQFAFGALSGCPSGAWGGPDDHRRRAGYPPEAADLRLSRHRDRAHPRAWLARFAGCDDVAFALEGCTGWRYVAEELAAAGCAAHVAEPADTAAARGRKRHAKTDKTDSRHLRQLLSDGRLPECWVPPGHILECRALLELYHDLRAEHTAWVQRIHAVFFHQGAPQLGAGALRTGRGAAAVRAAAAAHLSAAGQLQVATALDMLDCLEGQLDQLRRRLLVTARHLTGAKVLTARLYGVGPVTALAMTSWLGGAVLLLPQGGPVRRAGHHRLLLRRQALTGAPVPAGAGGPVLDVV